MTSNIGEVQQESTQGKAFDREKKLLFFAEFFPIDCCVVFHHMLTEETEKMESIGTDILRQRSAVFSSRRQDMSKSRERETGRGRKKREKTSPLHSHLLVFCHLSASKRISPSHIF